jgi:hypothetical protein
LFKNQKGRKATAENTSLDPMDTHQALILDISQTEIKRTPSSYKSKNKKRKQPLSSRETRSAGELEGAEADFTSALTALKTLSRNNTSTISAEFISAQKSLKAAKTRLHDLKRRRLAAPVLPPAYAQYPPPCDVPKDPEDPRFTLSFDVLPLLPYSPPPSLPHAPHSSELEHSEAEKTAAHRRREIQDFFDTYGFVVISNVLSLEECSATEAEIWVRAFCSPLLRSFSRVIRHTCNIL